jgi:hypothetical protein
MECKDIDKIKIKSTESLLICSGSAPGGRGKQTKKSMFSGEKGRSYAPPLATKFA